MKSLSDRDRAFREGSVDWALATDELERGALYPEWGVVPRDLDLFDGRLFWSYAGDEPAIQFGAKPFSEFLQLHDASPERILAYAQRWGPLHLCDQHDQPAPHPRLWGTREMCMPAGLRDSITPKPPGEPVYRWKELAAEARSIINVAGAVRSGRPGSDEDWDVIYGLVSDGPEERRRSAGKTIDQDLSLLEMTIEDWITAAHVRPYLTFNPDGAASIHLGGGSLFSARLFGASLYGAIASQLLFAVSRSQSIVLCSNCGAAYAPKRRPAVNRRNYCDECRADGAPRRDASRAYWRRRHVPRETAEPPRR